MSSLIELSGSCRWTAKTVPRAAVAGAKPVRGAIRSTLPSGFLLEGVWLAGEVEAQSPPVTRGEALPALEFDVSLGARERAVVVARHPSGAMTFHGPDDLVAHRGAARRAGGSAARFRLALRPDPMAVRGVIGKAVKLLILKLKDTVLEKAMDAAAGLAIKAGGRGTEWLWWKAQGREEGWFQVSPAADRLRLRGVSRDDVPAGERSLLLLHGTFSHAASCFRGLAGSRFFEEIRPLYGDRVFAFNHFTVSRSPEDNVRMLLEFLRDRPHDFDVITHSRGGLVLRQMVELPGSFGGLARRMRIGHAVLVASPNAGTPLATPERWNQTLGLMANLIEMVADELPDNPWTTGVELVANGLVWMANNVPVNLPGLAAMDGNSDSIAELQAPPGPGLGKYSALTTNYNPGVTWKRWFDCGLDGFFGEANDLVVPSRGGWTVDADLAAAIPPERVGCFGEGGNLRTDGTRPVHHLNFFFQAETPQFLLRALQHESQSLELLDLDRALPKSRLFRTAEGVTGLRTPIHPKPAPATAVPPDTTAGALPRRRMSRGPREGAEQECDDTLHLMILGEVDGSHRHPKIVAIYGSARVMQDFHTTNVQPTPSGPDGPLGTEPRDDAAAGTRYKEIIDQHNQIGMCLAGEVDAAGRVPELPDDGVMREFGRRLFDSLLRDDVKRLYDVARSAQRARPLNVVLTCNIPWIARLPWEFSYDPARFKFLITEEVHFVRNVLTSVPAERSPEQTLPLRTLVVVAQPLGTAALAVEDEQERVRASFRRLIDRGLMEVEVLSDATPESLHRLIQSCRMEERGFDIVHFIGHGDFDREANEGKLLFVSRDGGAQLVHRRTLREIFCGRGIQLIFLNACDTARDDQAESNRGIAQSLVAAGLPAVVANQYKVLDPSAITFADHFYWSLAQGASLGEAAREARIALNYSLDGVNIDWAVPVLYARDPDYRICERARLVAGRSTTSGGPAITRPPAPTATVPEPSIPRAAKKERAKTESRVIKVAVVDLTRSFRILREVTERLNGSQGATPAFQLNVESITAPLGVWRRERVDGRTISYLDADRFSEKMNDKPRELGADCLICITDQWLAGTVFEPGSGRVALHYNLYAWGHPKGDHPVMLISTAGLSLPPQSIMTERVFGNLITAMLGDFVLEKTMCEKGLKVEASRVIHDHTEGDKTCPFYYNPERDLAQIAGVMRFDARCRRLFRRHMGAQRGVLPSLESMLRSIAERGGEFPEINRAKAR